MITTGRKRTVPGRLRKAPAPVKGKMQMKEKIKQYTGKYKVSAAMTVFFALLTPIFLAFLFALVESVRFSGARAHTAALTQAGCFSVFGEYEKKLLEDYEVFAVDGSYGEGEFSLGKVNDHLKSYIGKNTAKGEEDLSAFCFDPWQVSLKGSSVEEYTLLSDDGGEPFYQQAVSYMKQTAVTNITGKLLHMYHEAQEAEAKKNKYEKDSAISSENMEDLEKQEQIKRDDADNPDPLENQVPEELPENPLEQINRLRKKSLLEIVCPGKEISSASVSGSDLCSKRFFRRKGNLKYIRNNSGIISDLLFREYLIDKFPSWQDNDAKGALHYQLEYILAGKKDDKGNLKSVIMMLLLLREGCNYAYAVTDPQMNQETEGLAALLIGWTGIAPLVGVLKHALLLGWSYAESLMDVRILMDGGNVPFIKTPGTWTLSIDQLYRIADVLESGGRGKNEGYSYEMHLRILLNLQGVGTQKKRGLDLAELNIRKTEGLSSFRADNCIVGMKTETDWNIPPVFGRVSALFLPVGAGDSDIHIRGGYAYDMTG